MLLFHVVCCCLLLFVVVVVCCLFLLCGAFCCVLLLFLVVCCCLLLFVLVVVVVCCVLLHTLFIHAEGGSLICKDKKKESRARAPPRPTVRRRLRPSRLGARLVLQQKPAHSLNIEAQDACDVLYWQDVRAPRLRACGRSILSKSFLGRSRHQQGPLSEGGRFTLLAGELLTMGVDVGTANIVLEAAVAAVAATTGDWGQGPSEGGSLRSVTCCRKWARLGQRCVVSRGCLGKGRFHRGAFASRLVSVHRKASSSPAVLASIWESSACVPRNCSVEAWTSASGSAPVACNCCLNRSKLPLKSAVMARDLLSSDSVFVSFPFAKEPSASSP